MVNRDIYLDKGNASTADTTSGVTAQLRLLKKQFSETKTEHTQKACRARLITLG
jgi:hypothetical protein